ncbi:hypothetical protein [Photobacterium sanguinicancri]|uniref:hypothetical protein n=1 Tax=Photobacterium sanguinicancri TaxID=875932 RepID=UPI0026E3E8FA|nr:hypothetical protein [Photobacterium sanguinicancri]MDO6497324.1 hypothetical protein [Photobacterium sanguinicancri]
MRAAIKRRPATARDEKEWQDELAAWGIETELTMAGESDYVEVWEEHATVLEWWLSIPAFLRWNGPVCLGMDVCQVKADVELSARDVTPADYQKLKLIANEMTEELNRRE